MAAAVLRDGLFALIGDGTGRVFSVLAIGVDLGFGGVWIYVFVCVLAGEVLAGVTLGGFDFGEELGVGHDVGLVVLAQVWGGWLLNRYALSRCASIRFAIKFGE